MANLGLEKEIDDTASYLNQRNLAISEYIKIINYGKINTYNRDYVLNNITNEINDCYLVGRIQDRLPNNLYICFKGIDANNLVSLLDLDNVQASTGSACNNGSSEPSNTMKAIGFSDYSNCIRFTFSCNESIDELNKLCLKIKYNVETLRNWR